VVMCCLDRMTAVKERVMQKISVIVPCYNAEPYLQRCLTALLSQSYPSEDYEVILIDNNSTDDSLHIAQQFPRIKLLREKKQGAYAARNRGLAEATGTLIAFTDADCVPAKDWLCHIVAALQAPQVYLVLGSRQWVHKPSTILSMLEAFENQKIAFALKTHMKELYYGYTNNMAVRREVFAALGPFVERPRGADTIFVHRVFDAYSYEAIHYDPSIRVYHQEINSVRKHYQKMWIYGRSNRLSRPFAYHRPLSRPETHQVLQETVSRERYSPLAAHVLGLLSAGEALCYIAGQMAARWSLRKKATATSVSRGEL